MNDPVNHRMNDSVNDQPNDVDWWASRLIDHEIAFADVPAELRGAVHERVEEFGTQRRTLLRLGTDHRVDVALTDRAVNSAMNAPDAVVVPLWRRLTPLVAVAAASIAVIVVGMSVLQGDDRPDLIAVDAPVVETGSDEIALTDGAATTGATPSTDAVPVVDESASAMSIDSTAPDTEASDQTTPDAVRRAPLPAEVTEIADVIELAEFVAEWSATPPALLEGPALCDDSEGRPAIAVNVRFAGIDARAYFSPEAGVVLRAVADCLNVASIVP